MYSERADRVRRAAGMLSPLRLAAVLACCASVCVAADETPPAASVGQAQMLFRTQNVVREIKNWRHAGMENASAPGLYLLAFEGKIGDIWLELGPLGVKYRGYAGRKNGIYLYQLQIDSAAESVARLLKEQERFVNMYRMLPREKVSANLWQGRGLEPFVQDSATGAIKAKVGFWSGTTRDEVAGALLGTVDSVVFVLQSANPSAIVIARPWVLRQLAGLAEVRAVSEHKEAQPLMSNSRDIMLVDSLQGFDTTTIFWPPMRETVWHCDRDDTLTGDSIVVGVWDVQTVDWRILDFRESVDSTADSTRLRTDTTYEYYYAWPLPPRTHPQSYHAAMVAGIALGNGWRSDQDHTGALKYRWRGVAPKALLLSLSVVHEGNMADVNNHSHGTNEGYYGSNDRDADAAVCRHDTTAHPVGQQNNVMVYAVGNSGHNVQGVHVQGLFSVTAGPKNPIKVGSLDKQTTKKSPSSSSGPTYDGRLGPDVMVPAWAGDQFEAWDMEVDYIQIASASDTVLWDFDQRKAPPADCDSLYWGCHGGIARYSNLRRGDGDTTLCFEGNARSYASHIYSDIVSFPAADTAELRIRYRISDSTSASCVATGEHRLLHASLYWQTDTTELPEPTGPFYEHVEFFLHMNDGWHEEVLPLRDVFQVDSGQGQPRYEAPKVWSSDIGTIRRFCLSLRPTGIITTARQGLTDSLVYKYHTYGGTSAAAPQVTGLVALMLQKYRDRILRPRHPLASVHDHPFWNSTARAILIHTARDLVDTAMDTARWANPDYVAFANSQGRPQDAVGDIYTVGPDWATGYGLVNAVRALQYVDTLKYLEDTIAHGQLLRYTMNVPVNTDSLRVTMVWDDKEPPGTHNSTNGMECKIVNELDVYLIPPGADSVCRPWVLDYSHIKGRVIPTEAAQGIDTTHVNGSWVAGISPDTVLRNPAVPGLQRRENVEVIDVNNPASGEWLVIVEGHDIVDSQSIAGSMANPKQDFSLAFDYLCESDTGMPQDELGCVFGVGEYAKCRNTNAGGLMLGGQVSSGALSGLVFGSAASITSDGDLHCSSLSEDQAVWLDSPANLSGGLVLRRPDGKAALHIGSGGHARIRTDKYSGLGSM